MRMIFAAGLVLGACGGGGGPDHWKDQPLQTVDGTFKGIPYTIELPKGMPKSSSKYSDEYQYHAQVHGEGYAFAPMLSVGSSDRKKTLADALKDETKPIIDKQETAEGWVYVVENNLGKNDNDFILDGQKFAGAGALTCHARVYAMKKGEDVKELIPRVEKMCMSLTAKK